MVDKYFETPVLYIVFNRPNVVEKTFSLIAKQKPRKLFIACDGPRNKTEKAKTDAVRDYILKNVNWECDVKTRFLDKNLGCKDGVSSAVDWFFENVDSGIILEDDCVPSDSFFRFCEEMLKKYENNSKVVSINGYNFLGKFDNGYSYYFSKYFNPIGWASWKNRWFAQDKKMNDYLKDEKSGKLKKIFKNLVERAWMVKGFRDGLAGKVGAWDNSFAYLHYKNNGACIKPKINLIENIGFMKDSTHTSGNFIDNRFYCLRKYELDFPLKHPEKVEIDKAESRKFFNKILLRIFLKKLFFL